MSTLSIEQVENQTISQMIPDPYRVERIHNETYDTFTLELRPANGSPILRFAPGQFNMLYLFGVGEVPISISGDPSDGDVLIHTIRAVGTVTKAMRKLKRGDLVGVRGPFGSRWPVDELTGKDVVILAGGIGLPPLRPAIYEFLAKREQFGKLVLLYGARTPEDMLFKKELEAWRSRFDIEVLITVDRATDGWKGNVGVITTLIPRAPLDPDNAAALMVGPEIMMRYCVMELQKRGLSQDKIYVSMERNMKCAVGFCGHCQYGPVFICKDGPVFRYDAIHELFTRREI